MKKIYALMALATTLTASAVVSPVAKNGLETAMKENAATAIGEYTFVENNNGMMKAPAVGDVNNYYAFSYYGRTDKDNKERNYCTIQIKKISDTEVEIYGLATPLGDFGVKGTYNASAQTITIAPQSVVPAGALDPSIGEIRLYTQEFDVVDGYIENERDIPSITFTYCPNGVQMNDGSVGYIGGWLPDSSYQQLLFNTPANIGTTSGFIGGWKYGVAFGALEDLFPEAPAFTYNSSEWSYAGKSSFTDGWFGVLSNAGSFPAYEVDTYVNNADGNIFMLKNPYGAGSPYASINTYKEDGFLILDITNPDCVLVRPNVNAGFVAEEYMGVVSNIALTTAESDQYYMQGSSYEDIIEEGETFGDEIANINSSRLVSLPTCRLQMIPDFNFPNYWIVGGGDNNPRPMVSKIQLADPTGVEGVINDTENAPKRFFNLQGLEIANPEAGELVIVKQGNKTTKTIVK